MLNAWLAAPVAAVKAIDFGGASDMMDPGYVFLVKGWNRCVSMMTVLYACFDKAELLKAGFQKPKTCVLFTSNSR